MNQCFTTMGFVTPLISILCYVWSDCVSLHVSEETIHINYQTSVIDLHCLVTNCSNTDFLFYNLKGAPIQGIPEELLFNGKGGAGFVFNIYDSNDLMIRPIRSFHDSVDNRSLDGLKGDLQTASSRIREQRVVIQKGTSFNQVKRIDLRNYRLKKGIYKIHLVYTAGEGITNEIDEQDIKEDERSEGAICFKGWIKSNITLTLE